MLLPRVSTLGWRDAQAQAGSFQTCFLFLLHSPKARGIFSVSVSSRPRAAVSFQLGYAYDREPAHESHL